MLLLVVCSAVAAGASPNALANSPQQQQKQAADALVKQGAALGKAKHYAEALADFKRAEAEFPQAEHDCWIAITYFRMQRLSQAEYFLDRCQQRAHGTPNLPWFAVARARLSQALAKGGYAPVSVETRPEGASLRAPGFAPDERLTTPVTLWLAPGKHSFAIESSSGDRVERLVAVEPSQPTTLRVDLARAPEPRPQPKMPPAPSAAAVKTQPPARVAAPVRVTRSASSSHSPWSWIAVGGGAAAALAGGVFHYLGYEARKRASDTNSLKVYNTNKSELETDRALAFSLYAVGAVAIGTGIYLFSGDDTAPSDAVRVGGVVDGDGAAVAVWGRF